MDTSADHTQTLQDEIALVTGASRGIGNAVALRLGAMGAKVIGTATSKEGADRISKRFAEAGMAQGSRGCVLDLAQAGDEALEPLQETLRQSGMPSILVNNAGITRDGLLLRMSDEAWREVLDVNLGGIFRISRMCLKAMYKAKRGRIINISSVVAFSGNPGQSNYAAAKAGITGFTKALAREAAPRNITVNAIAPGFIKTDMTMGMTEQQQQQLLGNIALGRWGEAGEVASVVAFLASPEAGYITGETLHVNGGLYMA